MCDSAVELICDKISVCKNNVPAVAHNSQFLYLFTSYHCTLSINYLQAIYVLFNKILTNVRVPLLYMSMCALS